MKMKSEKIASDDGAHVLTSRPETSGKPWLASRTTPKKANKGETTSWKLLHTLFGWDYIAWKNMADQGVARVHKDALGLPYYWRYKNTKVLDVIRSKDQVVWLTCKPEKYIKSKEP